MVKVRDDLTGKRFGRLTVIRQVEDYVSPSGRRIPRWLCKCDCGNEVEALGSSLKSGDTKSCGCLNDEKRKIGRPRKDLVGQRFGRLTVIKRAEDYVISSGKHYAQWECKCDCGNTTIVKQSKLIQGRTKSCGCYRSDVTSKRVSNDLTGKRFGKLTVIERCGSYVDNNGRKNSSVWLCMCDCGNLVKVKNLYLTSGDTKSCGCLSSMGEAEIARTLTNLDIDYDTQYHFDDLRSDSGGYLYFDFAVYDCAHNLAFLIEYQGQQHYEVTGDERYGKMQREVTDDMKRRYCNEHNISLCEIRYDEDVEEALEEIVNEYNSYS